MATKLLDDASERCGWIGKSLQYIEKTTLIARIPHLYDMRSFLHGRRDASEKGNVAFQWVRHRLEEFNFSNQSTS